MAFEPPRPLFIKVRTTFFKTVFFHLLVFGNRATDGAAITIFFKRFSSMKIFKFLQGLVGFRNLRFAEIKSCPSASPTYELRKVEISETYLPLQKLKDFHGREPFEKL